MRFKLEKRCSKHFIRKVVSLFFGVGFFAQTANATLYVSPANGGSVSGSLTQGGSIYYFAYPGVVPNPSVPSPAFADPSFVPLSFSNDVIKFNIYSDVDINLNGSQKAVITYFAYPNTETPHQGPIREYNGEDCSRTSNCVAYNWTKGSTISGHYFAAIYPTSRSTVTIGIKLSELCQDANTAGATLNGNICSSGVVNTGTGANGYPFWNIQLSFSIVVTPDGNQTTPPSDQTLDSMSTYVNLYFQSTPGTFVCPATETLNQSFIPGENEIFLNTALFGVTPPPGGGAPMARLFVVGKAGGAPITNQTFNSPGVNDFVSTPGLGLSDARTGGFLNDTDYNLSFVAQDQTGVYISPNQGCGMGPVRTSEIQGFLPAKNKNCFIATATFRSPDSGPVVMFREFRDEFLLKFSLGRSFVNWYYSWSPGAADWLNAHPIFRFSLLLLFLPIEGIAWLILHPIYLGVILGVTFLTMLWIIALYFGRKEGSVNER